MPRPATHPRLRSMFRCIRMIAGMVQRQWVWLLIFSPLWASLFINYGLGPVVSRTKDPAPVVANCAGFAAAAALPFLGSKLAGPPARQEGDGGM